MFCRLMAAGGLGHVIALQGGTVGSAGSAGFFLRFLRKAKRYVVPLVLLDAFIIYHFSLHLKLAVAARSLLLTLDRVHVRDPRATTLFSKAEILVWESAVALVAACAGTLLCLVAVAWLCWTARCLRQRKRQAARIEAWLLQKDERIAATVVDISSHGCRVQASKPLASGSSVTLALGEDLLVRARVVWRQEAFVGLHFLAPLPNQALPEIGRP